LEATQRGDPSLDFYLGRLALWFDDEPAALSHLERAVAAAPKDARIHNALGDAYGLAAQNAGLLSKLGWAQRCKAAYERAVGLEPENVAYRWSLVGYFCIAPRVAGGGLDKAYLQAEEIRKLDAMAGRIAFATLFLSEKKFPAAFQQFEPVLRNEPDSFMALYHVGRCAALSGTQLARGLAALRRCLELQPPVGDGMPTHASVHYRIGNILEKKGDKFAAEAAYARAKDAHPDFRPAKIALKN
jgi:tetratricopeptide (TPR) repeat protein